MRAYVNVVSFCGQKKDQRKVSSEKGDRLKCDMTLRNVFTEAILWEYLGKLPRQAGFF